MIINDVGAAGVPRG